MVHGEGTPIERSAQSTTDRDLLGRLAARDAAAFALLYDRHAPRAFGTAVRLFDDDQSAAERAVEQLFLAVWRGAPEINAAHASLWPWLLAQLLRSARATRIPSLPRSDRLDGPMPTIGAAGSSPPS